MFNSTANQFVSKTWRLRLHSNPKCEFTHSFSVHVVLHHVLNWSLVVVPAVTIEVLGKKDFSF